MLKPNGLIVKHLRPEAFAGAAQINGHNLCDHRSINTQTLLPPLSLSLVLSISRCHCSIRCGRGRACVSPIMGLMESGTGSAEPPCPPTAPLLRTRGQRSNPASASLQPINLALIEMHGSMVWVGTYRLGGGTVLGYLLQYEATYTPPRSDLPGWGRAYKCPFHYWRFCFRIRSEVETDKERKAARGEELLSPLSLVDLLHTSADVFSLASEMTTH